MTSFAQRLFTDFDPELPLERARTIPASWYRDPEVYALERRAVFGDSWLAIGRRDLVAEPGAFVTADLAGEPILVVRDEKGTLRAFFNVCRHRAAPVLTEACGRATRLRCRYHGWTYDLAGRLRGTPEFDGVAEFCREEEGLAPLAVAEWGPYVWAHAGDDPPPLDEFLAPLPERTANRLAGFRHAGRRDYEMACNWKVFIDNYLDGGYHVNTVHPGLAGILDYTHYRTEVHPHGAAQLSPLKPPDAGSEEVSAVRGARRPGPDDDALYWWVFPGFMLNLYRDVLDVNLVLPLGPERCRVVYDYYFAERDGPLTEDFVRDSIAVTHRIQEEDGGICEEVQRGLASRSFRAGRYSVRRETAVHHFHRLLARQLRAAVPNTIV